jgi:threonine dehydratase
LPGSTACGARNTARSCSSVEDILLVTDDEMRDAARLLWLEHGLAVDLSGAASLALLTSGKFHPRPGERVCALICGAGSDGLE